EHGDDLAVGEAGLLHGTSSGNRTRKFHFWRQLTCGGITVGLHAIAAANRLRSDSPDRMKKVRKPLILGRCWRWPTYGPVRVPRAHIRADQSQGADPARPVFCAEL